VVHKVVDTLTKQAKNQVLKPEWRPSDKSPEREPEPMADDIPF
jgi:hypothetical protein